MYIVHHHVGSVDVDQIKDYVIITRYLAVRARARIRTEVFLGACVRGLTP